MQIGCTSRPGQIDPVVAYCGRLARDGVENNPARAGTAVYGKGRGLSIFWATSRPLADTEERAQKSKEEWGLDNLSIAYGLSEEAARAWGLHITESIKEVEPQTFSEPALFWVLADKKIYLMDVASMPFARPDLELLLAKVPAITAGYPARGTK